MTRALVPNSTQVPDVILDFWLSVLTGAELKIVFYVARRTYGFGKESDNISLSQLAGGIKRRDGTVLDTGTGLSRSTVKTACAGLVKRGILLKTSNTIERTGEFVENTYRLNLEWNSKIGPTSPPRRVGRGTAHPGQRAIIGVGRKSAHVGRSGLSDVGRNSALQETEYIQETAAAPQGVQAVPAAELLGRLVSAGINRSDAARLALHQPEECEKQLEYLAYRVRTHFTFKRDKGAFLRRAIEDNYAPPGGYTEHLRKQEAEADAQQRKAEDLARSSGQRSRLIQTLTTLETERPEEFSAFLEYVESKKQYTVNNPILNGAPGLRRHAIQSFDSEDVRLELLAEFLDEPVAL